MRNTCSNANAQDASLPQMVQVPTLRLLETTVIGKPPKPQLLKLCQELTTHSGQKKVLLLPIKR